MHYCISTTSFQAKPKHVGSSIIDYSSDEENKTLPHPKYASVEAK